jgi:hypothetical protein
MNLKGARSSLVLRAGETFRQLEESLHTTADLRQD